TTMLAPSRAHASAISRPMPREAPVMKIVFPFRPIKLLTAKTPRAPRNTGTNNRQDPEKRAKDCTHSMRAHVPYSILAWFSWRSPCLCGSIALELGFALFHERGHALREVGRLRAPRKCLHLRRELLRQRPLESAVHEPLGLRESLRRAACEPQRDPLRFT